MKLGSLMKPVTVAAVLLTPVLARAETHSEGVNGATCIAYPPFDISVAVPYSHFLYGFQQSAFCHFTVPNGWALSNLSYVMFSGSVSAGAAPMRVRLCVYSGFTATCGTEKTLSPGGSVNWVAPPSPIPPYASGAYLSVRFASGAVSTLQQFHPVFSR